MGSTQLDIIDEVVRRETDHLKWRGAALRRRLKELLRLYPSANTLQEEIDAQSAADEVFLAKLQKLDWGEELAAMEEQFRQIELEPDSPPTFTLKWSDEGDSFSLAADSPTWKSRAESAGIDLSQVISRQTEVIDDDNAPAAVTYPIIFTHEVERNHRALARSIGWALVVVAAQREVLRRGELIEIRLEARNVDVVIDGDLKIEADVVPPAKSFGFSQRGEIFRRLDDFVQTDEEAHLKCWVQDRERAPKELRVLREQGGAGVEVEVDRQLRRVREIEKGRSEVVRKRKHVFVDPAESYVRDRYLADEEGVDDVLEEVLRRRIEAGFRIRYERLEFSNDVRERGFLRR